MRLLQAGTGQHTNFLRNQLATTQWESNRTVVHMVYLVNGKADLD
jgi:hypothetical protein